MFLKITPTTNLLISIVAIVMMVLMLGADVARIARFVLPHVVYKVTTYPIEILQLLLFYYLASVLMFFKEKRFIVISFLIFHFVHDLKRIQFLLNVECMNKYEQHGLEFELMMQVTNRTVTVVELQ